VADRVVRDDPLRPDPGFAELYASLPDATDLQPWLSWGRRARPPVLYLGVGSGRLAVPLVQAGVEIVGVDAHPGMLERLHVRLPAAELVQGLIEDLDLGRRFDLVMAPSNILTTPARLRGAVRHSSRLVAFELLNPHWLLEGPARGVRVRSLTQERAELEIDYPGGWRQAAEVALTWPEEIESVLEAAGLELELMKGAAVAGSLAESPSYEVLARTKSW
jgi:hypothetical protein